MNCIWNCCKIGKDRKCHEGSFFFFLTYYTIFWANRTRNQCYWFCAVSAGIARIFHTGMQTDTRIAYVPPRVKFQPISGHSGQFRLRRGFRPVIDFAYLKKKKKKTLKAHLRCFGIHYFSFSFNIVSLSHHTSLLLSFPLLENTYLLGMLGSSLDCVRKH